MLTGSSISHKIAVNISDGLEQIPAESAMLFQPRQFQTAGLPPPFHQPKSSKTVNITFPLPVTVTNTLT